MTDTPALRPPEEFAHLRWHWLRHVSGTERPLLFNGVWSTGSWSLTPREMGIRGWTYIAPCIPPTPPDEATVERVARAIGDTQLMVPGCLRDLLCATTYANDHVIAQLLRNCARTAIESARKEIG